MKVKFKQWNCDIKLSKYGNGRPAMQLIQDGAIIAVATVNCPDEPLQDGEVVIKDYSENEGMIDCLVKAGVISPPIRSFQQGWVTMLVCRLLI